MPLATPCAHADESADWKDLTALRKQLGEEPLLSNPAEAREQLQAFLKSRPLDPVVAAEAAIQATKITRAGLQQPEEAMKLLQAGFQASQQKIDPGKPTGVMYLDTMAASLLEDKKIAEAKSLLEKNRSAIYTVRLWLADYYGSIKDERVLALSESILAKMPRPLPKVEVSTGDMPLAFQALERIAWYYDATGQNSECAQAWLRMSDYCPQKGWWLGDMWLMSARALDKEGKHDEAQKLRANVAGVGNGWITALAAYEEALPLMNAGKLGEAKSILSRPIMATEQVSDGKIGQNAWLASLAYRQDHLDEALRYGQVVEEIGKLNQGLNGPVKDLYNIGHDIYLRAGGWKTQPIQCDVKELILKTNPLQPDKPLYARFRVKTYEGMLITATVDDPSVEVIVSPVDHWKNGDFGGQSEVVIKINRNVCRKFFLTLFNSNENTSIIEVSLLD